MSDELIKKATPKNIDLGLSSASLLTSGSGWATFTAESKGKDSLRLDGEFGAKLNADWAAYGKVWAEPLNGSFGGGAGVRFRNNVDLFVEGTGNINGDMEVAAGISFRI